MPCSTVSARLALAVLVCAFSSSFLVSVAEGKVIEDHFKTKDNWKFVAKFVYGMSSIDDQGIPVVGTFTWDIQTKNPNTLLLLYYDTINATGLGSFEDVYKNKKLSCRAKSQLAARGGQIHIGESGAGTKFVERGPRPHIYYLVLADCTVDPKIGYLEATSIKLTFKNEGGKFQQQLSFDEQCTRLVRELWRRRLPSCCVLVVVFCIIRVVMVVVGGVVVYEDADEGRWVVAMMVGLGSTVCTRVWTLLLLTSSLYVACCSFAHKSTTALPGLYIFFFVAYLLLVGIHVYSVHQLRLNNAYHPIVKLISVALAAQFIAVFLMMVHWTDYASNGKGVVAFRDLGLCTSLLHFFFSSSYLSWLSWPLFCVSNAHFPFVVSLAFPSGRIPRSHSLHVHLAPDREGLADHLQLL